MAIVTTAVPQIAAPAAREGRIARPLITLVRKAHAWMTDTYRPELHYMRGPGPKWHAKHGSHA